MKTDRKAPLFLALLALAVTLATAGAGWSQPVHTAPSSGHWDPSFGFDGLDGTVYALEVYAGELYAAGNFTDAAGTAVSSIARWDGSQWRDVGGGVEFDDDPGTIRDLAVYDDGSGAQLYAVGEFDRAGTVTVLHAARWDGNVWTDASAGYPADVDPSDLGVVQGTVAPGLYSGGITFAYGCTAAVFRWDAATSSWLSLVTFYPEVTGIDGVDDGSGETVFVGGPYFGCSGVPFYDGSMKWDGAAWQPLGSIFQPQRFIEHDGEVYAGGITVYDDYTLEWFGPVEIWDGVAWQKISSYDYGSPASAYDLEVYDDCIREHLFVGGAALTPAGKPVDNVYKLGGTTWRQLGSGIPSGTVYALEVYDGDLYVAGDFSTAGGNPVENVARWNHCN